MRINQQRLKEAAKYQTFFAKQFPNCFVSDGKPKKPLAVGIDKELFKLADKHDDISKRGIMRFLRLYSSADDYIQATRAPDAMRVNLQGKPVEPVSKAHQAQAASHPRTVTFAETRVNICEGAKRKRLIRKALLKEQKAAKVLRAQKQKARRLQLRLRCQSVPSVTRAAFLKCKGEEKKQLTTLVHFLNKNMPTFKLGRKNYLFPVSGKERSTLAEKVQAAHPEITDKVISCFWNCYTGHIRYLKATQQGSHFLDIEGNPIMEITEGAKRQVEARITKIKRHIDNKAEEFAAKREKFAKKQAAAKQKSKKGGHKKQTKKPNYQAAPKANKPTVSVKRETKKLPDGRVVSRRRRVIEVQKS